MFENDEKPLLWSQKIRYGLIRSGGSNANYETRIKYNEIKICETLNSI